MAHIVIMIENDMIDRKLVNALVFKNRHEWCCWLEKKSFKRT